MSSRTKILLGLTGVLVTALAAGLVFLRYQVRKSFPETTGSVALPGVVQAIEIARDEFGVPRIHAENEHDLLFALGYVHAQDRLWQMDIMRRAGLGRLSELFGTVTLPFDRMFRIIGIRRIAEEVERHTAPASRGRLQAYAEGVNAYIASHQGKYPIEFDLLGYDPEPWTPLHSIIIGRMMAWELNLSWWVDLTLGTLVDHVGYDKAKEVFPSYPPEVPPIVPSSSWHALAPAATTFLQTAHAYCAFSGIGGMMGGSNAWVIAPRKSENNSVLLANDTHLQLTNPAKWYEVNLHGAGYDVGGFSIPGVPGIVSGNNADIAWGVTNVMADDADFYVEKIDSTDPNRYLYEGRSLPLTIREEEIVVRGDTTHSVTIRSTHHGPLVTDIHTTLRKSTPAFAASMRWTGTQVSDQIEAFAAINRARTWEEFLAGVKQFSGPGQNFVYGDAKGNIGYWCGVWLPIRSAAYNSLLPLPGWEKESEWQGFVPFEELPHLFNPPEGFIATANNKIVGDSYPYRISELWEPPARFLRLREVLSQERKFSAGDVELLQNDQFSYYAKRFTPHILHACQGKLDPPYGDLVMAYFTNWNFVFSREDVATALFQQFLTRLMKNLYEDEMGSDLLHDYLLLVNIPLRVTMRLVEEGTSSWFDNVHTNVVETRDEILLQSMKEALSALREQLGDETKNWQWGNLHTVTLRHPFGLQKPLDKVFNIGPFPYGGGSTALTSGEYSFTDVLYPSALNVPFGVTVGASFRRIVDMRRPFEVRSVLPTGQSGQAFHPHFNDQTPLWLNGAYKTVRTDSTSARHSAQRLVITPVP